MLKYLITSKAHWLTHCTCTCVSLCTNTCIHTTDCTFYGGFTVRTPALLQTGGSDADVRDTESMQSSFCAAVVQHMSLFHMKLNQTINTETLTDANCRTEATDVSLPQKINLLFTTYLQRQGHVSTHSRECVLPLINVAEHFELSYSVLTHVGVSASYWIRLYVSLSSTFRVQTKQQEQILTTSLCVRGNRKLQSRQPSRGNYWVHEWLSEWLHVNDSQLKVTTLTSGKALWMVMLRLKYLRKY